MANIQIYLAGRMSGLSLDEATGWRREFAERYAFHTDRLPNIFIPPYYFNYDMNSDAFTDMECFRFELRQLKKSDALVVNLKDIEKSIGTCQELMAAYLNDIPVVAFSTDMASEEVYSKVHPWLLEEIDKVFTGETAIKDAADYVYVYYGGDKII